MHYRRSKTPDATYFFTVVTYQRRPILCEPDSIALLREAFKTVKQQRPFQIEAIVILLPGMMLGTSCAQPTDSDQPPSLTFSFSVVQLSA